MLEDIHFLIGENKEVKQGLECNIQNISNYSTSEHWKNVMEE